LTIQWDQSLEPYYRNRSAIVLTASVDAIWTQLQSELPQPSSVEITDDVYVLVDLRDFDHDTGVTGMEGNIIVRYLTSKLAPAALNIIPLGGGIYNISFSTSDLLEFSRAYTLNITFVRDFYTISNVKPSFSVTEISTTLTPLETEITLLWTQDAIITVTFDDLLYGNFTSGALVNWSYGVWTGNFTEIGSSGVYTATISTSLQNSGTRVVKISADADKYQKSTATVTLIVLSLPSDMTLVTPDQVFAHPRGDAIDVKVFLNDTFNDALVPFLNVDDIYLMFNATRYDMDWNGTDNSWYVTLNSTATEKLPPGYVYTARIIASLVDYDPTSTSFKFDLLATKTYLNYYADTTATMEVYYSDTIAFDFYFNATDGTPIDEGEVYWSYTRVNNTGQNTITTRYNFTHIGSGLWNLDINTAELDRWGTFGLTFNGIPANSTYDSTFRTLSLTVKSIPTVAISPPPLTVYWGWKGNISFTYYDTFFEKGISSAEVATTFAYNITELGKVYDLGNGTYSVYIDTTLLDVTRYRLIIAFNKKNYVATFGGLDIFVQSVPTELIPDTPQLNQVSNQTNNLVVPYEESIRITVFYNDTDFSDFYVGGLYPANYTAIVYSGGIAGVVHLEMTDYRNGTYVLVFNSLDASLFDIYPAGALPSNAPAYQLDISLKMDYREEQTISFSIRIIERPTEAEFVDVMQAGGRYILNMSYGFSATFTISFTQNWQPYRGLGIVGAAIIAESDVPATLEIRGNGSTSTSGVYYVDLFANAPFPVNIQTILVDVQIRLFLANYEEQTLEITIRINPTPEQETLDLAITWGMPISIVIMLLGFSWVRVFSIPKRLRQINGQIKALRKGKMPKPIAEVNDRQQLVADLFNDTNKELKIVRAASEMPVDSIPVAVPEMG
ncbi:MAG: hypothetical protein ACFFCX_18115, partial [Candidatus Sifarchaeia archaeon]